MGRSLYRGIALRKAPVRLSRPVIISAVVLGAMSMAGIVAGRTEAPESEPPVVVETADLPAPSAGPDQS